MGHGIALASPTLLGELAALHGGMVDPDACALVVGSVAPIATATEGQLGVLVSRRRSYMDAARATSAAILVDQALADRVPIGRRWVHSHASYALARLLETAAPSPPLDARGAAHIDPGADVDATASIGVGAVILAGAHVGRDSRIEPNAVIYGGSWIGARVVIGAGAVIGRAGFGWTTAPDHTPLRVPQLGGVEIQDDVEVGPLATVDAGTLSPTVIERGAKLDAHVHVGHNVVIGAGAIVAAQAGFAGSSTIGAGVLVGGQVGVADHVRVGPFARLAAKAGVIGDVAAGTVVAGYPAVPRERWLRATAWSLRHADGPSGKRRSS